MSTSKCVTFAWCDIAEDDDIHEGFHREPGITRIDEGVLRTDHTVEDGQILLSIVESFEWYIEADKSDEFFAKLHRSVDEAKTRFDDFKKRLAPLRRNTEPGEPEFAGIGGGL